MENSRIAPVLTKNRFALRRKRRRKRRRRKNYRHWLSPCSSSPPLQHCLSSLFDPLSYLGESILVIIISLLPFKEAVRTSVLSKRWNQVWRHTRSIEFDESFFIASDVQTQGRKSSSPSTRKLTDRREVLFKFSQQWICHYRQPKVDKFRLSFCWSNKLRLKRRLEVEQWIRFAVDRHVVEIDLDFSDPAWIRDRPENHRASFRLPSSVYQCRMLQSLKLSACGFQGFRNFNELRTLSVEWKKLTWPWLRAILTNCRMLENLKLKKCKNLNVLNISENITSIRTLVIEDCSPLRDGISISTLYLQSFKYFGLVQSFYLESLRQFWGSELEFGYKDEFDEVGKQLCDLLHAGNMDASIRSTYEMQEKGEKLEDGVDITKRTHVLAKATGRQRSRGTEVSDVFDRMISLSVNIPIWTRSKMVPHVDIKINQV